MNARSLTARLAAVMMRLAEQIMPAERAEWLQAMRGEFLHIDNERAQLGWAFGCLRAGLGTRALDTIAHRGRLEMHRSMTRVLAVAAVAMLLAGVGFYASLRPYQQDRLIIMLKGGGKPAQPNMSR